MKIRAVLGGNVLLLSTGSAPISAEVIDFLKIALYCDVTEGTFYSFVSAHLSFFIFQGESESLWLGAECQFFSQIWYDGELRYLHAYYSR